MCEAGDHIKHPASRFFDDGIDIKIGNRLYVCFPICAVKKKVFLESDRWYIIRETTKREHIHEAK